MESTDSVSTPSSTRQASAKKKQAAALAPPASSRVENGASEKMNGGVKDTGNLKDDKDRMDTEKEDAASVEASPLGSTNGNSVTNAPSSIGKGQKSSTGNKTYVQLIAESIEALKDRTGSSVPAIKKWLFQEYPHLDDSKHFRQKINQALRSGTNQGRFEKVRCSYKISSAWKAAQRKKRRSKQGQAATANANSGQKGGGKSDKESAVPTTYKDLVKYNKEKLQKLEKTQTAEELEKTKQAMRKKEASMKAKEEAERKEKERLERIRKRRFPMEDTKLHKEDKELAVKPPPDVKPRPYLPYFWQVTLPLDDPSRQGKTSDYILRHSKSDALDQGIRGLVSDMMQVYHFFRGDVHFTGDTSAMQKANTTKRKKRGSTEPTESVSLVPDFTLSHLIYATEEILNGNARKSKLVPPLISHLFVTCLQLLCRAPEDAATSSEKDPKKHLQFELNKYLLPALTPGSWSDICHLYMDAMERFFRTDSSRDPNVLVPLNTDLKYLFGRIDEPLIPMTPATMLKKGETDDNETMNHPLPEGYDAYLGERRGMLFRAHEKLGRSEAWSLSAEELMTLLRALTDDVLATYPGISENIARREEEMYELLKAKKAADSKFRKVKFAYEGPKKPKKAPEASASNGASTKVKGENSEPSNVDPANCTIELFKPTATKKEFDSALRAQQKANDAYEKGIRTLVARTEPVGYDRSYNAVYCFRHDPEVLYVEELRPPSNSSDSLPPEEFQCMRRSWHVIETTSLFDLFVSSLDIRGKREQELYEGMLGPAGGQQSMRRYLHDDVKANSELLSRRREKEALEKRLEAARIKCDEEQGRRSGRLADQAEEELTQVQKELERFEKQAIEPVHKLVSPEELTGLSLLVSYDEGPSKRETRRTREKKETTTRPIAHLACSKIIPSGNIDGSGIVGMMVSQLLSLEEQCQSVSPWPDEKRKSWISKVEGNVIAWYNLNPIIIGPEENTTDFGTPPSKLGGSTSASSSAKRRRGSNDTPNSTSVAGIQSISSVISSLKQPLLDLEARVADITNLAAVSRDEEIADENMSTDGSEGEQQQELDLAWRKEVHKLRQTLSRQHLKVRERLVRAISLARKAHASDVVSGLRAALLLFHPNAASDSRKAAIKVLEDNGDYSGSDFDEEESEDEAEDEEKAESEEAVSVLSAEAALLTCCLGGSDDATRQDWIDLVKASRTLARLSSLIAAFAQDVEDKIDKILDERDELDAAISAWKKEASKKKSSSYADPSEVWADVTFTDEFCMAKAEDWPWWPAKICVAKDDELKNSLADLGRVLVALMGEMGGLRIVKKDMVQPFTGEIIDEDGAPQYAKKTRNQLEEAILMVKRINRGTKNRKANGAKGT